MKVNRVFLFDGYSTVEERGLAERRLDHLRHSERRPQYLKATDGEILKCVDEFVAEVPRLVALRQPLMILVHTSAIQPTYLAKNVSSWDELGCRLTCLVLYSGVGVTQTQAAPMLTEGVVSRFAFISHVVHDIESPAIVGNLGQMMDHFNSACTKLLGRPDSRSTFLSDLQSLMERINSPFRRYGIALHILCAVYLASRGLDPSTNSPLHFEVWRNPQNLLENLSRKESWDKMLPSPGVELEKALQQEGFSMSDALQRLINFIRGPGDFPNDAEVATVWRELDRSLSGT